MKALNLFKSICKKCNEITFLKKKVPKMMSEDEITESQNKLEKFLLDKKLKCPVKLCLEFDFKLDENDKTEILDKLNLDFPKCSFCKDKRILQKTEAKQQTMPKVIQTQIKF